MKLRDYINNNELEKSDNIENDSYIVAKRIIMLVKNKDYNEAMLVMDNNIEKLYKDLNLPSFCFLIDYYINNIEKDEYLDVLNGKNIPSLLINLAKDYNEKNKMYFINKLNEYSQERKWLEALSCIEILLEKTDIDKLEMDITKLNLLINLKRYNEALIKCDEMLNINPRNQNFNNTKVEILIFTKKYKELDIFLNDSKYYLSRKSLLKSYIILAKYFEAEKEYNKSYRFYEKAYEIDSDYKIPSKVINKTKSNNNQLHNKLFLTIFILILISVPVYKFIQQYKTNQAQTNTNEHEIIQNIND